MKCNAKNALSKFQQYGIFLLLISIFLWGVFVRFGDLHADPAFHLSKSAGVFFDPFSHSGNARSYILFGDLSPDQWDTFVYSPIYVLLQVVWFSIFGITVKTMHAYGATYSIFAVGLSWFVFRKFGFLAGFLALTFFSAHYVFFQFGRLALLETAGVFFTVLTFFTLIGKLTRGKAFLCGALSFVTFTIKATLFYTVPAAGIAVVVSLWKKYLEEKKPREVFEIFGWFVLGIFLTFTIWLFLFRIPNAEEIDRVGAAWWRMVRPESFSHALDLLIRHPLFYSIDRHDFISTVVILAGGITFYRIFVDVKKVSPLVVFMLCCVFGGAVFSGILDYSQVRFCIPILPAMFGIAAISLVEFYDHAQIKPKFENNILASVVGIVTLSILIRADLFMYKPLKGIFTKAEFGMFSGQWDSLFASFLFAVGIWIAIMLFLRVFIKTPLKIPKYFTTFFLAAFLTHFLYQNLSATSRWWDDRHHSIVNASRKIADVEHMVIGGLSVHALVMENTHRAVRIQYGWHNDLGEGIFTDLDLTHLLLTDYLFYRHRFIRRWSKQMSKTKRIDSFYMCGQLYHLYALERQEKTKKG